MTTPAATLNVSDLSPEIRGKYYTHKRLYLAHTDFSFCEYWTEYLLKNRLHSYEWERKWTVYYRQTAFVTALVVAYCRPFNGRGPISDKFCKSFTSKQLDIHRKIKRLRNSIFAHSDSEEFGVTPIKGGRALKLGPLLAFPPNMLTRGELTLLAQMLRKLEKDVRKEQEKLQRQLESVLPDTFREELEDKAILNEFRRSRP